MKIPLIYQSTDYDCVPTTIINGLNYLLDREKIDPIILKTIMSYSLDQFDKKGVPGKGGTSKLAVELIANWLESFSQANNLGISCTFLNGNELDITQNDKIKSCIEAGGVFLACVYLNDSAYHYVLVTGMDEEYVYFFDPYSIEGTYENDHIEIIQDMPFKMNRKASLQRFNAQEEIYYALGIMEKREGVLLQKI